MNKTIEKLRKERRPIASKCIKDGHVCSRAEKTQQAYCKVYAFPGVKWRLGDCPMADNELRATEYKKTKAGKVRVGQQKQKRNLR